MSPLQVKFLLTFYTSRNPKEYIDHNVWNSPAGKETRDWIVSEGLAELDENMEWQATPRLKAYADHICAQPLPECHWVVPQAKDPSQ